MLALLRTLTLLLLASFAVASVVGSRATTTDGRLTELTAVPLSNAQRLARGLPLRTPRRLYSPTREPSGL
jgi:hypothetical protein